MSTNKINEKEIFVGENRFYLGEDNIIYVTVEGEFDVKLASEMEDAYYKLINISGRKTDVLVENTRSGKPSQEARAVFKKMIEHEFTGKVSVYGTNMVSRILAAFIIGLSNDKNMHFSKTRQKAIKWLKEPD
jgi:hypothetical protein